MEFFEGTTVRKKRSAKTRYLYQLKVGDVFRFYFGKAFYKLDSKRNGLYILKLGSNYYYVKDSNKLVIVL